VMMFLPLLAVALAVPPKRSTSAIGVFLSIVMLVAYYKINEYAEGMGSIGLLNPFFAIWVPFVIFVALVGWMFYTLAYVPGGQPIGGLDRAFGKAFGALKRLFSRFVRKAH
jgi:lipopolysaccharide export system permease protein